jgi:hypothetical protein
MRIAAGSALIALSLILMDVQPLKAQKPSRSPPRQTQSKTPSVQNKHSREEKEDTREGCIISIQSRINDVDVASHTAEFHDDQVKWQSRETYTMRTINDGCSFRLSRHLDFQSGPYPQERQTMGSRATVLEVADNVDFRDLDPNAIETEMQSDSMNGQTAALILRPTARKSTFDVRKQEDIHFFDKTTRDTSTSTSDSRSELVIHFRDMDAANKVATAFERVIPQCGGIAIPKDIP